MRYSKTDVTLGGLLPIPRDRYTVRVLKAVKSTAKSGNLMAVLTFEILYPESVEMNGEKYSIAGRQFVIYQVLVTDQSWGVGRLIQALEKAEFDFTQFNSEAELDDERLDVLEGFELDMILRSEEETKLRPPTDEEKQAGKKDLQPILDGEGRPIKLGWRIRGDLQEVVGPATHHTTDPNLFGSVKG